jgi:uncharacterized membrane protein YkoI
MIRKTILPVAVAGMIAIGVSAAAYARNENATDEAAIIANAKVSMVQAITTAEQQVGGKAVGTGIEDQDGTVYFEVQVLKNGTRHKVLIDPQTGKVVKTVAGDNERNENGREGDDD